MPRSFLLVPVSSMFTLQPLDGTTWFSIARVFTRKVSDYIKFIAKFIFVVLGLFCKSKKIFKYLL